MRLLVITPEKALAGEAALANRMLAAGLERLHLRRPGSSPEETRAYLQRIEAKYRGRVALHQHHECVGEVGVQGLHYPERLRPAPPLPRTAAQPVSTSLHNLEDLCVDWGAVDYAFLSPIYNSISKQGYAAAAFDRRALKATLSACPIPIIALGGVTADKLPELRDLGFAGIAVIGSVWAATDPLAAFEELKAKCDELE